MNVPRFVSKENLFYSFSRLEYIQVFHIGWRRLWCSCRLGITKRKCTGLLRMLHLLDQSILHLSSKFCKCKLVSDSLRMQHRQKVYTIHKHTGRQFSCELLKDVQLPDDLRSLSLINFSVKLESKYLLWRCLQGSSQIELKCACGDYVDKT